MLSVASLFYRGPTVAASRPTAFLVLVPAHDEELVIADTLASLGAATRPQDKVLVIADRCSDRTAEVARGFGVEVLERRLHELPGKVQALRAALNHASGWTWDAVVTIDADSVVEPGFFAALEAVFALGAEAVQARSEHQRRSGVMGGISEIAFALQGVVLPRGRDRLGLTVRLRGSGMALGRELALTRDYSTTGISEDTFYGLELTIDGVRVRHADRARLRSLSAPSLSAATEQRLRWETGRLAAARRYFWRLLARPSPSRVEAAVYVITPPVAVAGFLLLVGASLAWFAGAGGLAGVLAMLVAALVVDIAIGLIQSGAPLRTWLSLAAAPWYVLWKVWLQLLAFARIGQADQPFEPTRRA